MEPTEIAILDGIISGVHDPKIELIKVLQDVQGEYGYLKDEHMRYLAKAIGTSYTNIYGVATFYSQFNLNPPGRNTIFLCEGTACHVKGGQDIRKKLTELLGIDIGQTTEDRRYSIKSVRCIGCCGLAPVININEETFGRVKTSQLEGILAQFE
jgi:NADH:ubiquinone oxidoreductase subunit E